jgi:hypothetical protein
MEIALPSKDKMKEEDQTRVKASRAITILLGKENKVYYYEGTREKGVDPLLKQTDFSPIGLRQFLIRKNYDVLVKVHELKAVKEKKKMSEEEFEKQKNEIVKDKKAPIVLIKATDGSVYRNLIDVLDEMAICDIDRYAIVEITPYDLELIARLNAVTATPDGTKK